MPDAGTRAMDKEIAELQKRLEKIYKEAAEDIRQKIIDYQTKYAKKDAEWQKRLADTSLTEKELKKLKEQYASWQKGQVFIGKQWEAKAKSIAQTMTDANKEAAKLVRGSVLKTFAENLNYELYKLEKQFGIMTTFDIYDAHSVSRLIKESPKLLPEWKINEKKDYIWNYEKVKNSITQGIIQGEGIPQIAKRLSEGLAAQNDSKMVLFARTANTEAQNAGRVERMQESEEIGVKPRKMWVATLDDRTRDEHQYLDGQIVDADEDFITSDGRRIAYPGDPNADPDLVYNCRCTIKEIYEGTPSLRERRAYKYEEDDKGKLHRTSYITTAQTYTEWKAAGGMGYTQWKKERHHK